MKTTITILALSLFSVPAYASTLDSTVMALGPAQSTAAGGQSFTVGVSLDEIYVPGIPFVPPDSVSAFQFDIEYPSFLVFDSITEQGLFAADGGGFSFDAVDTPDAVTGISDALTGALTESPNVADLLVTLQFTGIAQGTGSIAIDPDTLLLADSNFDQITPDPSSGLSAQVTVTPEPSSLAILCFAAAVVGFRRRRSFSGNLRA